MNKFGRNEIPIDWDMVDELLACGCTGTEIAAKLGMHQHTLYRRVEEKFDKTFSAYLAEKKAVGDALIRETQYKKALGISKKGDNTLLIWLGKQRLNQKENITESVVTEEINKKFDEVMNQISSLQNIPEENPLSE